MRETSGVILFALAQQIGLCDVASAGTWSNYEGVCEPREVDMILAVFPIPLCGERNWSLMGFGQMSEYTLAEIG